MKSSAGQQGTVHWQLNREATLDYADGTAETYERTDERMGMFENLLQVVRGEVAQPLCTVEVARQQVACTEKLHQGANITTVPPRFVRELEGGQRVIEGVSHAVQQTLLAGQLFSETGAAFASV